MIFQEQTMYSHATIRIWHQERKTDTITEYYVLIASESSTASLIITYDTAKSEVKADVYTPPDYDYTIHDACDHESDDCVLDDPASSESEDMAMNYRYDMALHALEKQVKQNRQADEMRADGKRHSEDRTKENELPTFAEALTDAMLKSESEVESIGTIQALLKQLPTSYPPTKFEETPTGYALSIDHTVIFRDASAEDALKHTRNYVEAREGHPDLPVGVIYGIYD
jgi:hypothetical protein